MHFSTAQHLKQFIQHCIAWGTWLRLICVTQVKNWPVCCILNLLYDINLPYTYALKFHPMAMLLLTLARLQLDTTCCWFNNQYSIIVAIMVLDYLNIVQCCLSFPILVTYTIGKFFYTQCHDNLTVILFYKLVMICFSSCHASMQTNNNHSTSSMQYG